MQSVVARSKWRAGGQLEDMAGRGPIDASPAGHCAYLPGAVCAMPIHVVAAVVMAVIVASAVGQSRPATRLELVAPSRRCPTGRQSPTSAEYSLRCFLRTRLHLR